MPPPDLGRLNRIICLKSERCALIEWAVLRGSPVHGGAGKVEAGKSAHLAHAFAKRFINHPRLNWGKQAPEPFMRTEAIRWSIGLEHKEGIIADIRRTRAVARNQMLRAAE